MTLLFSTRLILSVCISHMTVLAVLYYQKLQQPEYDHSIESTWYRCKQVLAASSNQMKIYFIPLLLELIQQLVQPS